MPGELLWSAFAPVGNKGIDDDDEDDDDPGGELKTSSRYSGLYFMYFGSALGGYARVVVVMMVGLATWTVLMFLVGFLVKVIIVCFIYDVFYHNSAHTQMTVRTDQNIIELFPSHAPEGTQKTE